MIGAASHDETDEQFWGVIKFLEEIDPNDEDWEIEGPAPTLEE